MLITEYQCLIRECMIGEVSDYTAIAPPPPKKEASQFSSRLQLAFFPFASSDVTSSPLLQFFLSGLKSKTRPFLILHHDQWPLNLINVVRSYQKRDRDVCISPPPDCFCHNSDAREQKDVASLPIIFS